MAAVLVNIAKAGVSEGRQPNAKGRLAFAFKIPSPKTSILQGIRVYDYFVTHPDGPKWTSETFNAVGRAACEKLGWLPFRSNDGGFYGFTIPAAADEGDKDKAKAKTAKAPSYAELKAKLRA
jgi:hypothetical protein